MAVMLRLPAPPAATAAQDGAQGGRRDSGQADRALTYQLGTARLLLPATAGAAGSPTPQPGARLRTQLAPLVVPHPETGSRSSTPSPRKTPLPGHSPAPFDCAGERPQEPATHFPKRVCPTRGVHSSSLPWDPHAGDSALGTCSLTPASACFGRERHRAPSLTTTPAQQEPRAAPAPRPPARPHGGWRRGREQTAAPLPPDRAPRPGEEAP